jgi:hypothetical protein
MKKYLIPAGVVSVIITVSSIWILSSVEDKGYEFTPPQKPRISSEKVAPAPKKSMADIRPNLSSPPLGEKDMALQGVGETGVEDLSHMGEDVPTESPDMSPEDDPQKQLQYALTKQFEAEALDIFPLHTVESYNPLKKTGEFGPAEGEVWIRMKVEHSPEHKDIMAQVADHYKMVTRYEKPVTVLLWVGGRPWAKYQYPATDEK